MSLSRDPSLSQADPLGGDERWRAHGGHVADDWRAAGGTLPVDSQEDRDMNESRIIQLRQELGWTQEKLSTESGVGLRTIQRLEAGNDASLETL